METTTPKSSTEIFRFAHPFFTNVPPDRRDTVAGVGKRMRDYIPDKLEKIPRPRGDSKMLLSDIIGKTAASEIEKSKGIIFHAVGDTGHENGFHQEAVADAMSEDYHVDHPEKSPSFFLHLGDVIYYNNTDEGYHSQFYEPYKKYPGKIIAIPGNHDGELFRFDQTSTGQKKTLQAFEKNFCRTKASVPPAAGTIYRQMVSQPGVYWFLDAPFVQIIGLYSNVAEGPGYISRKTIGSRQKHWLTATLKTIKKQRDKAKHKALIIAVHHPPFSEGDHQSSTDMLKDLDECFSKSSLLPDAVLAAHAHSYQRFTRHVEFNGTVHEIPFTVAGSGGRGLTPHKLKHADGSMQDDRSYDKSLKDYGYQLITVSEDLITLKFFQVSEQNKKLFDEVKVDLTKNKLI